MTVARPVVFVVDDDASLREALETLLVSAGWNVELFASAQEFLGRTPAAMPRCLILDVNLPGIETARVWEPEPATVYFWDHEKAA